MNIELGPSEPVTCAEPVDNSNIGIYEGIIDPMNPVILAINPTHEPLQIKEMTS